MFHQIKKSLSGFGNFSLAELLSITSHLKVLQFFNGNRLISEDQVCRNFYFIESGKISFP